MITLGVDIGVRRVSLATARMVKGHPVGWADELDLGKPGTPRNVELTKLASFVWHAIPTAGYAHYDMVLWVERTYVSTGQKLNPTTSLAMAELVGAVMTAAAWPQAHTVVPSSWKAGLLGNGNAGKEEIREWLHEHHPALFDVCSTQDQIDAMCIALYGQGRADGTILAPKPAAPRRRKKT